MKAFNIKQIRPGIFLFAFHDHYEMAMHFVRYQEYYECASTKFRGKHFTILSFMDWYAHTYGNGVFTYTNDWGGFNIPGHIIEEVSPSFNADEDFFRARIDVPDRNIYDYAMEEGWARCHAIMKEEPFYIIGAVGKGVVLNHEMSHGFYYLDSVYRKNMNALIAALPKAALNSITRHLLKIGYTKKVIKDEIAAYFATGLPPGFELKNPALIKPFERCYWERAAVVGTKIAP